MAFCISGMGLNILWERGVGFTSSWGKITTGRAKNGGYLQKWVATTCIERECQGRYLVVRVADFEQIARTSHRPHLDFSGEASNSLLFIFPAISTTTSSA